MIRYTAVCTLLLLVSTACEEDEPGQGTLTLTVWGEEYIEQGIPAAAFADGFGVTFDKFLVAVSQIEVAVDQDSPAFTDATARVWDLTQTGPFAIASKEIDEGTYNHTAYTIAPAAAGAIAGNATDEDVQAMITGGYSLYAAGSATNDVVTKTFSWGFDTAAVYDPCHSVGILENGGAATVQLTIHGDHLFYDDATHDQAVLRFNDIALADTDGDGDVAQTELASYDITVLPNYSVPDDAIDTMWEYLSFMTRTVGHIDGEGHCGP